MIAALSDIKLWWLIILSFAFGGALMFLPLPMVFAWLKSIWLILILLYWVLRLPQHVNVGIAWLVGLVLDLLYNGSIGEHGLALIGLIYLITKFRHKIILLDAWQMPLAVMGSLLFYYLLLLLVQTYLGEPVNCWLMLGVAILGGLAWPLLSLTLFKCQLKLRT